LVALVAIVVYANALKAGFVFDDVFDIQQNPAVQNGIDLAGIIGSPLYPGDLYRPFTVLTFAINERLAPGSARAYHAVNILLHALVSVLIYLLATRIFDSRRLALIAAGLFAVHPIHTEAVTSLVGRAELLAAMFGVSAMLSMVAADATTHRVGQTALRLLSVLCFSLALLSKESAVVFIPLICMFRIACRREPFWAGLVRESRSLDWVPYCLCLGVFLLARARVIAAVPAGSVSPLDNALAFVPVTVRLRSALAVLWDYFGLLNVPLMLSADYSYAQVPIVGNWTDGRFLAGLALVVTVAAICLRDRRPAVTFAAAQPLVALLVTSNLLFPIGTIKAERLLYLPSVGWALLVAYGFDSLLLRPRYRVTAAACLGLLMVAFAGRTWLRNWDWMSAANLYSSMVRSAPKSAKAHYNQGLVLQQEGNDAAALFQFRRAFEIYHLAGGEGAALSTGLLFDRRGWTDRAIEWYRKALEVAPEFVQAHTNLCRALLIEKRFDEAAVACRRGLRYDPSNANLLKGLGQSFVGQKQIEKGIEVLRRSLALNHQDAALRIRLAELEAMTDHESGRDQ